MEIQATTVQVPSPIAPGCFLPGWFLPSAFQLVLIGCLLLAGGPAVSQGLESEATSSEGATNQASAPSLRPWRLFGDVRLRVDALERVVNDVERGIASARTGIVWQRSNFEVLGALRVGTASRDAIPTTDNEPRNALELDQALVRWFPTAAGEVTLGKQELPLWLTPMLWDDDLRPLGLSGAWEHSLSGLQTLRTAGGIFAGDHLFGDESRLIAAQLFWLQRQGAPSGLEVGLAYLGWSSLDALARSPLARTNRLFLEPGGGTIDRQLGDFKVVDVQIAGNFPLLGGEGRAAVDLAKNVDARERKAPTGNAGASDANEAIRLDLSWRQSDSERPWGVALSAQRIQADAVLAAFNSDDWWFHSGVRGVSASISKRLPQDLELRLSVFRERPDTSTHSTKRYTLDLRWRFAGD